MLKGTAEALFNRSVPVLCVGQLEAAISFYAQLGFAVDASFPQGYALLSRDGVAVHLRVPHRKEAVSPEANPCGAYFYVSDVDALALLAHERGVALLQEPFDAFYRVRECSISDPDGNLLRFGQLLPTDA